MDIADFSMSELLKELATRVTCQEKKQTRAILIGAWCVCAVWLPCVQC